MTARRLTPTLAAALCAGLLCSCGSGSTKTVSVADTATSAVTTASAASTSTESPTSSSSGAVATATGTAADTPSTRTQSGPAFAQTTTASGGPAAGPVAVVVAHGYTPTSPNTYNPQNTLQVIIATNQLGLQKAFFFVNGRYIGTDTSAPSTSISLVGQTDTEVTLGYGLMHPDGSSAGTAQVSYALDNGMLSPLNPIPSANPTAAVSRR